MTATANSFWTNAAAVAWRRRGLIVCIAGGVLLYAWWVSGLSINPPGFYLDESGGAYNAYLIATTGRGEFGVWFPLFPQFYTESFVQYSNPVHIYLMSLMYLVVPPSNVSARVCMATMTFIAVILLGVLATRISGRKLIGVLVALTAAVTPWIFEPSRLVLECAVFPLAIALLLFFVYRAIQSDLWRLSDSVFIALALAMTTYTYTIGRLLGPLLAFGLLIFVRDLKTLYSVARTWVVYAITMIPFFAVYFGGDTVTRRFNSVTWVDLSKPWSELLGQLWYAYSQDISLKFMLEQGDPLLRHHIPGGGELLTATFAVAMVGIVLVFFRHWRERWWWYVIFGLLIAILPGALTVQRFHALRTVGFPVFLIVLTVPSLMWLLGPPKGEARKGQTFAEWLDELPARFINAIVEWRRMIFNRRLLGGIILVIVLLITASEANDFRARFLQIGPTRGSVFDDAYFPLVDEALAREERPIYLQDGFWGPAYVHALWHATVLGVDRSIFYHLAEGEHPPDGSLVLSSNNSCDKCEIFRRNGSYLLFKTTGCEGVIDSSAPSAPPPAVNSAPAATPEPAYRPQVLSPDASKPHGMAVDASGNILLADSAHSRVLKLSPNGQTLAGFGENTLTEPTGIAVDAGGNLYVADGAKKAIFKFKSDGTLIKQIGADAGLDEVRDVVIGTDKHLYITDRGRSRVVKMDLDGGDISSWGSSGSSDGQFNTANGIAFASNNIYICDMQNDRVEVFDLNGNFVRSWVVPQWANYMWHRPDVVVDQKADLVYVTSGWSHEVLVFDTQGDFIKSLKVEQPGRFNNPSSIVLSETKNGKFLYILNTGADVVDTGPPSILVIDLSEPKK